MYDHHCWDKNSIEVFFLTQANYNLMQHFIQPILSYIIFR